MKIVFVSDQYWPAISGVSVSIDSFKKELENMGHEVFLLVPDYPNAKAHDKNSLENKVYRFKSSRIFVNDQDRIVYKYQRRKIKKIMLEINPDIVHVHTEFALGKMVSKFSKKNNIPLVMTAHTYWENIVVDYLPSIIPQSVIKSYCKKFLEKAYKNSQAIVAPTIQMESVLNTYNMEKKIHIIPTGIELQDFKIDYVKENSELYTKYPQLKGKKVLLYVGRVAMEKNIGFLVKMFKEVLKTNKNTMLVITGDGSAMEQVQSLAKSEGVFNNMVFTGFISRPFLKHFYFIADIFVFASKIETQGMVVLESLACGTPVVAVGVMGIKEVMRGDNGGFMVEEDLKDFTKKVKMLLNDPVLYNQKVNETKEYIANWTMQTQAKKMTDIYNGLIA